MRKIAAVCVIFLFPAVASATCARTSEHDAFAIRALQSQMMVAALSCNQQSAYNQLMRKHTRRFTESGKLIKAYFQRNYGTGYEGRLNRFVTTLANNATQASMDYNSESYCDNMRSTFHDLISMHDYELQEKAEERQFASLHGIKGCARIAQRR